MAKAAVIVWFRQDLRLSDNPVWEAAAVEGAPMVPLFVWCPAEEGSWAPGAASRWWLHQSLASLDSSLRELGSRLILRETSDVAAELERVAEECGATRIYAGRRVEPAARLQEERAASALVGRGKQLVLLWNSLLHDPDRVRTGSGLPYRVFTPFWRRVRPALDTAPARAEVRGLEVGAAPERWPETVALADLGLLPQPDWAAGLREAWAPGEAGAQASLRRFLEHGLASYAEDRNRPDREGTSRLSPHLHFGEISPWRVWREVQARMGERSQAEGAETFLTELGWREFAHHLLWHFPHTTDAPLRAEFLDFPWEDDEEGLQAWRRGLTGYPIVDAGLRELWGTGWMHNRVRMVVASFLVKDLLVDWRAGAAWFWDTLVDADLADNTLGWQWTAGCGADAAPYFRIFNPSLQGRTYDPDGTYTRRFVPELARMPARWIHAPWAAPERVLELAGVELGRTYPFPLVDHRAARRTALAAFAQITRGG